MASPSAYLDTYTAPGASQDVAMELMAPCYVGWNIHLFLFGIVVSNGFAYLRSENHKHDSRRTTALLWALLIGDFGSTCVSFAQSTTYGTSQKRNTNTLLLGSHALDAVPFALGGTIAFAVQLFLCHRASQFFLSHRALRSAFLPTVGVLSAAGWVASIFVTTLYALYTSGNTWPIIQSNYIFNIVTATWAFTSATVDLLITVALFFVLRDEVRGFNHQTDDIVRRVIRLGVETGAATAVTATAAALLAVSFGQNAVNPLNLLFAFVFPPSSLYTLSFIVTLNSRGSNLRSVTHPTVVGMGTGVGTGSSGKFPLPDRVWVLRHQEVRTERMVDGEFVEGGTIKLRGSEPGYGSKRTEGKRGLAMEGDDDG